MSSAGEVICPWCGSDESSPDWLIDSNGQTTIEAECSECEKPFTVYLIFNVSYKVYKPSNACQFCGETIKDGVCSDRPEHQAVAS